MGLVIDDMSVLVCWHGTGHWWHVSPCLLTWDWSLTLHQYLPVDMGLLLNNILCLLTWEWAWITLQLLPVQMGIVIDNTPVPACLVAPDWSLTTLQSQAVFDNTSTHACWCSVHMLIFPNVSGNPAPLVLLRKGWGGGGYSWAQHTNSKACVRQNS